MKNLLLCLIIVLICGFLGFGQTQKSRKHKPRAIKPLSTDLPDLDGIAIEIFGWKLITDSAIGRIYYHPKKIVQIKDRRYFWLKYFPAKTVDFLDFFIGNAFPFEMDEINKKLDQDKIDFFLVYQYAVCKIRFMKTDGLYFSWRSGIEQRFLYRGYKAPALPVVPDTIEDVIFLKVCQSK